MRKRVAGQTGSGALSIAQDAMGTPSQSPDDVSRWLRVLVGEMRGESEYADRLVIKAQGRVFLVRVRDIDWIEAAGNYVRVHAGDAEHLLRETMNGMEARLDPRRFLRIHRETIVNVDRVLELQPMFHGNFAVLLRTGHQLTLSRSYRPHVQKQLHVDF
jgi:two-component system LytT family response regulator